MQKPSDMKIDFDTITKPQGTFNQKVIKTQQYLERKKLQAQYLYKKKT